MLTSEDLESIELLIVGTESSPDQGKPVSTYVRRYLGVQDNCRNFECKHACYGGTSATMMAAHWVASGVAPGAKALVICADQGRKHFHERYEYVMGCGAVAMLISAEPEVLEFELEHNGYWTAEVSDTFRPTLKEETGNSESSVYCYLDALEGAFEHFQSRAGGVDYDEYFRRHVYHLPFAAMAYQAHRSLLRMQRRVGRSAIDESFERTVRQGLTYAAQVGGTYTGSTFYALAGLLASADDLDAGDRVSVFAYGSGSCGEFYSLRVGERAREIARAQPTQELLDGRRRLTVDEYESIETRRTDLIDVADYRIDLDEPPGLFDSHFAGQRKLYLRGLDDYVRDYDWS
jgi:hydroxymethylglutaryl-CoA synthase